MSGVSVSAPGKAIVAGEYAVLAGAPAISMAVNRRAMVRVKPVDEEFHSVTTPGYVDGEWRFRADSAGAITWVDAPPVTGMKLVEQAWRRTAISTRTSLSVSVDTREFFDPVSGTKLGIGSSAAAMTALVSALCQYAATDTDSESLSHRAHIELQEGLGSGVDVATSFHGGVIEYRVQGANRLKRHAWPKGLAYRVLWSGRPVATSSRIDSLNTRPPYGKRWSTLMCAAERVAVQWRGGGVEEILAALKKYATTLRAFSDHYDLGIFDAGHRELFDLATAQNSTDELVYKPCGAGGGDIGIVASSSVAEIATFCAIARKHDFLELSVNLDDRGVDIETGALQ